MARTKTVFGSHDQTAHVWAQARVEAGRSSDGRMFWRGRILYSYGTHFALGVVILAENGEPAATLLNSARYSTSTAKHKGIAWRAARGEKVSVPDLTALAWRLEALGRAGMGKADRAAYRSEVAAHIAKNWADYSTGSAAYVLGLVGGTAAQALAIITKAGRAADKAAEQEKKAANRLLIDNARELAKMDSDAFRAFHRSRIGDSAYSAPHRHETLLSEMRRAHKAASGAGLDKVKAAVWAHIKAMPALGGKAVAAATVTNKNRYMKAGIRTLRQFMANEKEAAPRPLNSTQWGQVEEAARALQKRIDNPAMASLANLHFEAGQLASRAYDAKHAAREVEQEAARLAYVERERVAALEEAEQKAEWLAGNTAARWRGRTENGGAYLRAVNVEIDGLGAITGTLQTSQGADVPLAHALRAFRFIKLCRAKGQAWQANGKTVPVGHFRIETIRANGDFVAGCHFIEWSEVERVALALGVEGWQADESAVVVREHA